MLGRISFSKSHMDIQNALAIKNKEQNTLSNQLSTQNRVQELRQDPMSASHGSRYASALVRKEVFSKQNREVYDTLQLTEGYMRQMIDMLQESRELSIRAANGTFTAQDRSYMAEEINQLIEEMSNVANSQDAEGRYLFGGSRTNLPPFREIRLVSNRLHKDVITQMEYVGSNRANMIEVSDNDLVPRSIPGSEMLWSRHTVVYGEEEALNFIVSTDSEIVLNNVAISLSRGDSIHAIIEKINRSPASVNASVDTFSGQLQLTGTNNEQMWISDNVGTVMTDLGIINDTGNPPFNYAAGAKVFEENLFDTMIRLRDAMYQDDYGDIGGRALASIDSGLNSVLGGLGKIGAITERLDIVYRRLDEKDIPNITKQLDEQLAIDMAETIVRWQESLQAQQAAYQVSSQMMQTSLLNYLK